MARPKRNTKRPAYLEEEGARKEDLKAIEPPPSLFQKSAQEVDNDSDYEDTENKKEALADWEADDEFQKDFNDSRARNERKKTAATQRRDKKKSEPTAAKATAAKPDSSANNTIRDTASSSSSEYDSSSSGSEYDSDSSNTDSSDSDDEIPDNSDRKNSRNKVPKRAPVKMNSHMSEEEIRRANRTENYRDDDADLSGNIRPGYEAAEHHDPDRKRPSRVTNAKGIVQRAKNINSAVARRANFEAYKEGEGPTKTKQVPLRTAFDFASSSRKAGVSVDPEDAVRANKFANKHLPGLMGNGAGSAAKPVDVEAVSKSKSLKRLKPSASNDSVGDNPSNEKSARAPKRPKVTSANFFNRSTYAGVSEAASGGPSSGVSKKLSALAVELFEATRAQQAKERAAAKAQQQTGADMTRGAPDEINLADSDNESTKSYSGKGKSKEVRDREDSRSAERSRSPDANSL